MKNKILIILMLVNTFIFSQTHFIGGVEMTLIKGTKPMIGLDAGLQIKNFHIGLFFSGTEIKKVSNNTIYINSTTQLQTKGLEFGFVINKKFIFDVGVNFYTMSNCTFMVINDKGVNVKTMAKGYAPTIGIKIHLIPYIGFNFRNTFYNGENSLTIGISIKL